MGNIKKKAIVRYLVFLILIVLSQTIFAVDINSTTVEELARELSGIGPIKARRIVEYREKIKGFVSIEQLMEIKGIGPKTLACNREKLKISSFSRAIMAQPTPRLNISPQIEKSPHQARNLFWDVLIIMPLLIVCLFIFITAWLKSVKT